MPKIAVKSGEIIDATSSPVDKMNLEFTLRQLTAHSLQGILNDAFR